VIAVDTSRVRLETAARFGATHGVLSDDETAAAVRRIVPGGVDFTFEAVGRRETAELSFDLLAPGGTCTVLGMVPDETPLRVPASSLYFGERRLQGAFIGSSRPVSDVPELASLYVQGRLLLDEMITHRVALADIDEGFRLLARGAGLRTVVDMPAAADR
jgi:S-(hydroxymethyl)glutathione dehydrogenase/alcohol dehydrogenase